MNVVPHLINGKRAPTPTIPRSTLTVAISFPLVCSGAGDFADSWSLTGFYLYQDSDYDSTSSVSNFNGDLSRNDTPGANTTSNSFNVGSLSLKKSFDTVASASRLESEVFLHW